MRHPLLGWGTPARCDVLCEKRRSKRRREGGGGRGGKEEEDKLNKRARGNRDCEGGSAYICGEMPLQHLAEGLATSYQTAAQPWQRRDESQSELTT